MAPAPTKLVSLLTIVAAAMIMMISSVGAASWCVAKSNVGSDQLLSALNYACGHGADCVPIQAGGTCFSPDTIISHANYAFNSYFHRNADAPTACDFAGAATISTTNPSYEGCTYPDSPSSPFFPPPVKA